MTESGRSALPLGSGILYKALIAQVLRRIFGTVKRCTTDRAGPPFGACGEGLIDTAAVMARFRGREIFFDHDIRFAQTFQLVLQIAESSVTGIHYMSQLDGLRHFDQIGVFHTHGVPGVGYPPALLV